MAPFVRPSWSQIDWRVIRCAFAFSRATSSDSLDCDSNFEGQTETACANLQICLPVHVFEGRPETEPSEPEEGTKGYIRMYRSEACLQCIHIYIYHTLTYEHTSTVFHSFSISIPGPLCVVIVSISLFFFFNAELGRSIGHNAITRLVQTS